MAGVDDGNGVGLARRVLSQAKLRSRLPDDELHDIASDASSSSGKARRAAERAARGANGRQADSDAVDAILRAATPGTASVAGSSSMESVGTASGDAPRSALRGSGSWGTPVSAKRSAGSSDGTPSSVAGRRTPGDDALERVGAFSGGMGDRDAFVSTM